MSTAEQIKALDAEFADEIAAAKESAGFRHWTTFEEAAERAIRIAHCIQILERQAARERKAA